MLENIILGTIIVVIVGAEIAYIIKSKKSGAKCIGCPAAGNCSSNKEKSGGCGCGCSGSEEKN